MFLCINFTMFHVDLLEFFRGYLTINTLLSGDPLSGWDLVPWRKLARSAAELRVFPAQLFFFSFCLLRPRQR